MPQDTVLFNDTVRQVTFTHLRDTIALVPASDFTLNFQYTAAFFFLVSAADVGTIFSQPVRNLCSFSVVTICCGIDISLR